MTEKYIRKPNTKCSVCGKAIYKRPVQIEANRGNVFCGQMCYGISCRKEKPCVVCGKPILSGLHRKTCSRTCSNVHRTGIAYGTGSVKDKVKSAQALKLRLISTRGTVCERCSFAKTQILEVHHKNRDRGDNRLENLELICPNCHAAEHYVLKK